VFCMRLGLNGRFCTAAVLFVLALALTACSRGGEESQRGGGVAVKGGAAGEPAPGAPDRAISGGVPVEAQSAAPIPQEDFGRKIVKTAQLGITSRDVQGEAARAQQVAARFGGTTLSAQTYRSDDATYADLVISVPSEQFEDALGELRGLGEEITTDTVSGQDVTEEYVDLQSQERNLLAAEQALLDLYNRADDVQDALSIQRELTTLRGEIEQVQGRLQYLKKSSDTSQISLSIRPVASPPKPPPAWDPALIVAKAWNTSLGVLQTLATAILSTLVFGWWIIPPLVLGAWWLRRRRPGFVPRPPDPEGGES
jgi:Domain of unknown function (DUF4349)